MAIIQFIDVYKSYQSGATSVTALQGVNLSFEAGDFVTIMGPSGGGKTTLLNLLAGLDLPDQGQILLQDRKVSDLSDHDLTLLRRKEIGFVFQFFNLMPTLTFRKMWNSPFFWHTHRKHKAVECKRFWSMSVSGIVPNLFPLNYLAVRCNVSPSHEHWYTNL